MPDARQARIREALRSCPLYFILDESFCRADPVNIASQAVEAGARIMQIRFKALGIDELARLVGQVVQACSGVGCIVLVNDFLEVALSAKADGVHLGAGDISVAQAREMAPQLIIGGTARFPDTAKQAAAAGADYLGTGSVFQSSTKPGLPVIGTEGIHAVCEAVTIPVVGIGGITSENFRDVLDEGASGFCSVAPFKDSSVGGVFRQFLGSEHTSDGGTS